jgi:hypothetical protein
LSYFNHDTHESFPWCHSLTEQIEARRAQLSGSLVFDILLTTGGVQDPATIFPPSDVESLRILLNTITNSTFDALKKDCLVYYLLKWHRDGRESTFYYERCIPPHFVLLADAYWHLDTGIQIAVRFPSFRIVLPSLTLRGILARCGDTFRSSSQQRLRLQDTGSPCPVRERRISHTQVCPDCKAPTFGSCRHRYLCHRIGRVESLGRLALPAYVTRRQRTAITRCRGDSALVFVA